MGGIILFLIYFGLPVGLLLLGLFAGNFTARKHEADILKRGEAVRHIRTTDLKRFIDAVPGGKTPMMVTGEVTLGIDHFRGFLGKLKNIFGGEVRSYEATLDRARREVILRLEEQAHAGGYNAIANLRLDFADISGNATQGNKASMVTILAGGTAYIAATTADAWIESPISNEA